MGTIMPDDEQSDAELQAFWESAEGLALATQLAGDSTWADPSPELEDRVVAAIQSTADAENSAGATPEKAMAPVTNLAARRTASRPKGVILPWLLAVAAVIVALAVFFVPKDSGGEPEYLALMTGTELAPDASAAAEMRNEQSGLEIQLEITGLSRAPAGSYYQAWLKGERGLVAIGTFHTGGTVVLWAGVDVKDYPALTVTLEPDDGVQTSSGQRLLVGEISSQ